MMIRNNYRLLPALALAFAFLIPIAASAQAKQPVNPFIEVQGKPGKAVVGLTPAQIHRAYGFDAVYKGTVLPATHGSGQTIAVVSGFHDPSIASDLQTFSTQFNLPQLDGVNGDGSLTVLNSCAGQSCSLDSSDRRWVDAGSPYYQVWTLEIAMDVEWAHAIAPQANIVLVEAQANGCVDASGNPCTAPATSTQFYDPTLDDLLGGVDVALGSGKKVSVVSMSWGGGEFQSEVGLGSNQEDRHFGGKTSVTFFASAGDSGHGVIYPAASPYVMSVGGTRLNVDPKGAYDSEKAWLGTGGGLSQYESEPFYQSAYPIPRDPKSGCNNLGCRGTPDVAYDAAPATGVAVYNGVQGAYFGWLQVGGTSAGPPQWSGLFALANSLRSVALTGSDGVLYIVGKDTDADTPFHDVSNGKDGNCGTVCKAAPGFDFLTGLGTPRADLLVPALVLFPF